MAYYKRKWTWPSIQRPIHLNGCQTLELLTIKGVLVWYSDRIDVRWAHQAISYGLLCMRCMYTQLIPCTLSNRGHGIIFCTPIYSGANLMVHSTIPHYPTPIVIGSLGLNPSKWTWPLDWLIYPFFGWDFMVHGWSKKWSNIMLYAPRCGANS